MVNQLNRDTKLCLGTERRVTFHCFDYLLKNGLKGPRHIYQTLDGSSIIRAAKHQIVPFRCSDCMLKSNKLKGTTLYQAVDGFSFLKGTEPKGATSTALPFFYVFFWVASKNMAIPTSMLV